MIGSHPARHHVLIFGLGYTGTAIARAAVATGLSVTATSRAPATTAAPEGVRVIAFDAAADVLEQASHIVVTAPPGPEGDPAWALYGDAVAGAARLRWIGYLSSTGVYGDHDGGWVDEDTPPAPGSDRTRRRLAAEQAWAALAGRRAVDIFRVAGIYGPGRSAFDDLRAGRARRIGKPGHQFGRIHRDDIARALLAAIRQDHAPGLRVLNLTDDEPAASADVIAEAAALSGIAVPPLISYDAALPGMSEMARSFWSENRKVSSAKTKSLLGLDWLYPSYREGLRAILAEEGANRPA
ncbi:MAG TPA: SDR family oxidoreductase [Acetobacteraceae bacterium]|jgi:nucleoside-diphosphate-sugar epimerase